MPASHRPYTASLVHHFCSQPRWISFSFAPAALTAQSVPPALESPAAGPPQTGPHGEKLSGMPKFHDPAPYDIDEHTGYKQIFDGKSFNGWDADPSIWRVENGVMVGETLAGQAKGQQLHRLSRRQNTRLRPEAADEDRKRRRRRHSVPQRHRRTVDTAAAAGQPPYDLKFMMTGPQADFWFPVTARTASYTGQWYSENTMQGILAYRGQVTQALPGQTNRLVANYRRHSGARWLCE